MRNLLCLTCLALIAVLAIGPESAQAGRTPTVRTPGFYTWGARNDITVPYLTTGGQAFMSQYVAPQILISPNVDNPSFPQVVPVYNLIFYGARQGFGDRFNGAEPKPSLLPVRR
jgi:hypothetical protein